MEIANDNEFKCLFPVLFTITDDDYNEIVRNKLIVKTKINVHSDIIYEILVIEMFMTLTCRLKWAKVKCK